MNTGALTEKKTMSKEKILVVDDEEDILELVRFNLTRESYNVVCVETGEKALELLKSTRVDLILLDLMLPGIDGFTVANRLKSDARLSTIPIIMLTAKGEESDVVAGLEIGADDYITKPFSPRVLLARLRTVLRRQAESPASSESTIRRGALCIDVLKHAVTVNNEPVSLTFTEFEVLALMAGRPGWAFSRTQIVDAVRGYNYSVTDRSVDVQIVGLRRKLGAYGELIETVRGVGYRFRDR
jgi:DNA-binding response OmpR family regulator